tara:strand:+ start:770 stop:1420 length:651 start_codon:yes stop_codon:yes gene_type:complete
MKLDVTFTNGAWVIDGNSYTFPEGTVAELFIQDPNLDIPPRFRVEAFDVGIQLAIALNPSPAFKLDNANKGILKALKKVAFGEHMDVDIRKFETYSFAKVSIDVGKKYQPSGSWFEFKENRPGKFICSAISFPEVMELAPVSSLNHAYTALSELIEPQRTSHTGNVYSCVFYEESDGLWYPLRNLREKKHHESHKVAEQFWIRYEQDKQNAFKETK